MKSLSKLAAIVTGVIAVVAFSLSPVLADSPGQLEGGTITYVVRNVTQNGSYSSVITASACDEVKYSVRLHNTSFGGFTNVHVNVSLPSSSAASNTSTMTATTDLGGDSGASSAATVNLSSAQSLSYENGSTVLYDENGNVIKTLPDTIASSGVDIGGLNGSTTEFVNFKAKVSCPVVPTPTPTPTPTPAKATVVTTTKALPNTGPGDIAELFVGTSAFGSIGHYLFRRNRR